MAAKRIEWLDIAKGIAIVSVVAGHTLAVSGLARHIIFTFHMPLFFVAAGYTFKSGTMGSVCRRSVKRLLIPYLMLSVIQWGGFSYEENCPLFRWTGSGKSASSSWRQGQKRSPVFLRSEYLGFWPRYFLQGFYIT